ncbi:HipA domain-containing protein [Sporosarcina luteola]|uniref:HipA domain-containing protein n=1 Tax=Sporosarcina luteola TaxID=582850 RepID=UPI0020407989|nr:HipA domain-containing protein [Sporosarcina luteola]MCM3743877.1 HipA domain-containing protein [Sporosarcina luteola]
MIDASLWNRDEKSQASGTRSKFWLLEPGTDPEDPTKYLFKIPTEGTGGHWAEFVASKVGKQLGFQTAEVELAEYQGVVGTISKNFRAKTEELYEGGDLFLAQFEHFDRRSLTDYELPHIIELLAAYDLEKEFVTLPVYDALIANNDRHCDNWGVLSGPEEMRLAPIYDNGSSLGFNEVIDKKKMMLTNDGMLAGFCNRGKPSIGLPGRKKPKHFELLSYLHIHLPDELKMAVTRLEQLNEGMLLSILNEIPNNIMCDVNKDWVIRLLLYRKNWILNWLEGV